MNLNQNTSFLFLHPSSPTPLHFLFSSTLSRFWRWDQKLIRMANVVELKVGLHCEDCIKKILKAIKKIQDIETYNVDTQLNKVTVTGNVTTEEVIKVLHKISKTAIPWQADEVNNQVNNIT
ncbi:copper transport protein ATX1 [Momordica charantia]|uniref:Copper transport protein ATX1 n=1 Tax=Momordica charantia TaxID=3673 RepID=A0A6J1BV52_MOMCH|nr:copper transport protein ATX1 [Momordica charantia]